MSNQRQLVTFLDKYGLEVLLPADLLPQVRPDGSLWQESAAENAIKECVAQPELILADYSFPHPDLTRRFRYWRRVERGQIPLWVELCYRDQVAVYYADSSGVGTRLGVMATAVGFGSPSDWPATTMRWRMVAPPAAPPRPVTASDVDITAGALPTPLDTGLPRPSLPQPLNLFSRPANLLDQPPNNYAEVWTNTPLGRIGLPVEVCDDAFFLDDGRNNKLRRLVKNRLSEDFGPDYFCVGRGNTQVGGESAATYARLLGGGQPITFLYCVRLGDPLLRRPPEAAPIEYDEVQIVVRYMPGAAHSWIYAVLLMPKEVVIHLREGRGLLLCWYSNGWHRKLTKHPELAYAYDLLPELLSCPERIAQDLSLQESGTCGNGRRYRLWASQALTARRFKYQATDGRRFCLLLCYAPQYDGSYKVEVIHGFINRLGYVPGQEGLAWRQV